MKTLSLLFLAIAAMLPFQLRAASIDDANSAFASGKYKESTQAYQAVLAEKGYSAPVLFDLGNSLFREGNFGPAILAYQRAQLLAPNDSEIAANLQLAQTQAGVAVATPQWSDKFTSFASPNGWAWIACAAWTLFCVSLLVRRLTSKARGLFTIAAVASAFILIDAVTAIVVSAGDLNRAVVVEKNAAALISPFPAAQTVFSPAPGETVTVQKVYNDFLLVTDHAGHSGWISKAQVERVVPTSSS